VLLGIPGEGPGSQEVGLSADPGGAHKSPALAGRIMDAQLQALRCRRPSCRFCCLSRSDPPPGSALSSPVGKSM